MRVRSAHEPARGPRQEVRVRRPDRAPGDRGRARARRPRNSPNDAADATLWFAMPGSGGPRRSRSSPAGGFPSARRLAYWLLAPALSFVDGQLIPFIGSLVRRRAGGRVPAREPARCPAGGHRSRRRHSAASRPSSTTSPAHDDQQLRLHPAPVRGRLARRLRAARASRAGRGGGGTRDPGRAGA